MSKWRMEKPCDNCPFNNHGPGFELRESLAPGRWRSILAGLRQNKHFVCHKTSKETGDGSNLVCAGSLQWSEQNGVSQNLVRIMERLDAMKPRQEVPQCPGKNQISTTSKTA